MRDFKFRCWDGPKKEMYYSEIIWNIVDEDGNIHPTLYKIDSKDIDSLSELMQYTSLKDKNDKEIYEGDLLKDAKSQILPIEYVDGGFWVRYPTGLELPTKQYREVVGNIYENPKLISKEQK